MASRLVFHIGLEKTGTTSFQQFCYDHSNLLKNQGIFYPKSNDLLYGNNHSILSASYLASEAWDYIGSDCEVLREKSVNSLIKLIDEHSDNITIISSEHFSSRFSEVEVEKLANDFGRYLPIIMVLVRDHYSVVRAVYSTWVLSGSRRTIDDFISMLWDPNLLKPQSPGVFYRYCRFGEMIEPWERFFGKDQVQIRAYDEYSSSINVIFSEISKNKINVPIPSHYRLNQTLEPHLIYYLRQFNMLVPNWDELFSVERTELWQQVCQARNQFLSLISEIPSLKTSEAILTMTPESHDRLAQLASADQVWLNQRGIHFSSKLSHEILISDSPSDCDDFNIVNFLNLEKARGDVRAGVILESINQLSEYRCSLPIQKNHQKQASVAAVVPPVPPVPHSIGQVPTMETSINGLEVGLSKNWLSFSCLIRCIADPLVRGFGYMWRCIRFGQSWFRLGKWVRSHRR